MSNVNVVRTGAAGMIQTNQYIGKSTPLKQYSTLNQKLGINPLLDTTDSDKVAVRYIGIGCGGHGYVTGANGLTKWNPLSHTARHTAMFKELPFLLRLESNDLQPAERNRYRLRRIEEHNGVKYVAYYLRVLDLSNTVTTQELRRTLNGTTTTTPFAPTIEDMNPQPSELITGQAVSTTSDYLATTAKIPFTMTPDEIRDFVAACKIIFGDDGYATISEMVTVAGVDRTVKGDFQGQEQDYTDVVRAEITSFIATAFVTEFFTDGITLNIDVGNVEPLLVKAAT